MAGRVRRFVRRAVGWRGAVPTRFEGTWYHVADARPLSRWGQGTASAYVAVRSMLRGRTEARDLTVPWDVGGIPSGEFNVDQALRLGPVYAAGRLIASNVAGIPLRVYRLSDDGEAGERLPLPALFANLADAERRSPHGGLYHWIFRAITSLAYRGNAIGLITNWDEREAVPTGVEWLNPDRVTVIDHMKSGPGSFADPTWYLDGFPVAADRLVHIPWFTMPGRVWGLSPLGAYAASVGIGLGAQEYTKDWFESGGVPPASYKNTTQTLDQADVRVIKKRLAAAIRSREPIVHGKDWEFTPITVPAHEAKFVETMRLTASQVAAIYGIPPEMIGGETGGSMQYSSPEQRQIELVQFCLLTWLQLFEAAFTALLPPGQCVRFDADAVIRTDIKTRFEVYELARLLGLMNRDEIRAREDLPPLPNGEGEDYTPLPIQAGASVALPSTRGGDGGRAALLQLVRDQAGKAG